jgi:hypothetical protein
MEVLQRNSLCSYLKQAKKSENTSVEQDLPRGVGTRGKRKELGKGERV